MGTQTRSRIGLKTVSLAFLLLVVFCAPAFAEEEQVGEPNASHLGGYVRTWIQMNLQDSRETVADDRGDFSMLRGSLLLDFDQKIDKTPIGPMSLKVIGRLDRENMTNYQERLQDLNRSGANVLGASGGPGSNLVDDVYDRDEIRELYVDMQPFERLQLRLGKQQVVWGETDFFRAMDVVHGFNYQWRSFLEPENEELRKPLILANARIQAPELGGSLQLLFRPGFDRDEDIGNSGDVSGGRYATGNLKGYDFLTYLMQGMAAGPNPFGVPVGTPLIPPGQPLVAYNNRHPDGDAHDPTYGARWSGILGPVGYSLAYLKTFSNDPVASTSAALGGSPLDGVAPVASLIELVYPKIDVFGMTMTGYVPQIDAVLSTEVVFTKDQPYNAQNGSCDLVDPVFEGLLGFPFTGTNDFFSFYLPGTRGGSVIKKDKLMTMLRMDKNNVALTQQLFGTSRPSFFSVQMFDEWILDFKERENILDLFGFGAMQKEHSTMLTVILVLNYRSDTINPTLAGGWDLSYQGGFFIPSCEFKFGDHWRARLEASFFFSKNEAPPAPVPSDVIPGLTERLYENDAHMMDYFARNDQLLLRLTYQF